MGKTGASKEAHLLCCGISPNGSVCAARCLSWAKMQNLMLLSTEQLVVSLGYLCLHRIKPGEHFLVKHLK